MADGNDQNSGPARPRTAYRIPKGATVVGARSVRSVSEHGKIERTPLADFSTSPAGKDPVL